LLEVRVGGRRLLSWRHRVAPALGEDRRVRLLNLLEAARGLGRAVVVVGVVELDEPPVGRAEFLLGDARLDAEDRVRVAAQGA
jgi:hypothetical protein